MGFVEQGYCDSRIGVTQNRHWVSDRVLYTHQKEITDGNHF